jgi:sugar (pentulose or hexulose) kinase
VLLRPLCHRCPLPKTCCLLATPTLQACKDAIADALAEASSNGDGAAARVKAIGVSGQQHGLVALDAAGAVIRPCMLWCDVQSAEEAQELSRLYDFTLVPSFTGVCACVGAHVLYSVRTLDGGQRGSCMRSTACDQNVYQLGGLW